MKVETNGDTIRPGTLSGAAWGFIIGDALGVPFEFKERGSFQCTDMVGYGTHNQPEGTWSDDSSMMLATCKSLKEKDLRIDTDDIRARFLEWMSEAEFTPHGDVFDIGGATSQALITGEGQTGERSNGNGSLMRILPLAFVESTDDEVREVSAITHGHRISREACVIYVNIIKEYLARGAKATHSLADIIRDLPEMEAPFDRLCRLEELTEDEIRSTGYVVDTLEAAFWCILQADREPEDGEKYARCLMRAVNLGDDTDTVAAVTGGLAGLIWSIDQLPADWIDKIKAKEIIEDCIF